MTDILTQYRELQSRLGVLGGKMEALVHDLLLDGGVVAHSVTHRVKDSGSLERKLALKRADSLENIHDLLGLRIITYFREDVERVGDLIEGEFRIDYPNSSDKGALLDPDRFGYTSLHYVAKVSGRRARLMEYREFSERYFEVQVRSILQHTWAEIEHDIGYKVESEIPRMVRRRLSRLAGLLEVADDEFTAIKRELARHRDMSNATLNSNADEVDQQSILAYLRKDGTAAGSLDETLRRAANLNLILAPEEGRAGTLARRLREFEIEEIARLEDLLRSHKGDILTVWNDQSIIGNLRPISDFVHLDPGACIDVLLALMIEGPNGHAVDIDAAHRRYVQAIVDFG